MDPVVTLGSSVLRTEDPRLLTGGGRYIADHHYLCPLHAAFVRSDQAHALLRSVDVTDAATLPGVVAVLTADDLPKATLFNARHPGLIATEQPVLAHDRVRFVGEAIAVVVATNRYVAEDGAEAVVADYRPLEANMQVDVEPPIGALLFSDIPGNVVYDERRSYGDVDAAFAAATHIVTRRLHFGRQSASPMETRGCIARYEHITGKLAVWASTQSPHSMRRKLSRVTGLPEHRITVHFHDVGGAFGQKIPLHPEEAVVALAAVKLGATVQWIEDRRENLLAAPHARQQDVTVQLAVDANGRFMGIRSRAIGDAGAYSFNAGTALTEPYLTVRSMLGPYRIDNYGYHVTARLTNKSPVAPYRGVGFVNSQVIRELVIDDAARAIGWDRIDLRRRNLVRPEDFPYTNAVGMVYDTGSYLECLDAVTEAVKYERLLEDQRHFSRGPRRIGFGISPFVEPTAPGSRLVNEVWTTPSGESDLVRVSLDTSAKATVSFGTGSQGQGIETTVAQVVSEELQIPYDDVAVSLVDTSSAPHSLTGTRGSRSAVITGGAAASAAREIRESVLRVAAVVLEASVDDLVLGGGRIHVHGTETIGLSLEEVVQIGLTSPDVRRAEPDVSFSAIKSFDPAGATYSNGCVGVVVEVDPVTGAVVPRKVVIAHDCGTVINPSIVEGQLVGAVVQGLGSALLEEIVYTDEGQPITTTFMDYLLPTAAEAVRAQLIHFESPSPHTWRGVKGAGEAGTIGMTAAVASAVADAAGDRAAGLSSLPLRPSVVAGLFSRTDPS